MNWICQYILSIVAAAILCSILKGLAKATKLEPFMQLLSGLFLTITLLGPLSKLVIPDLSRLQSAYTAEAEEAALLGQSKTYEAIRDVIKTESEAYILNRAEQLGMQIRITITLDSGNIPSPYSIEISGSFDPDSAAALSRMIESDLMIPKERQTWIGTE